MPWDTTRPSGTQAKYRSKEHRDYRAGLVRQLKRDGYLICTADECLLDDRAITNPDGRDRDGLHAGHNEDGVTYRGPQHRVCNVRDGSRRARAKQINGEETAPWCTVPCHTCGADIRTKYPKTRYCPGGQCTPLRPKRQPLPKATCMGCGCPVTRHGTRCARCGVEANREAARNAYRSRVGIPLDAPLAKTGRPRRWTF